MSITSILLSLFTTASLTTASLTMAAESESPGADRSSALDVEMSKLGEQEDFNLAQHYQGKVVLLVNVASRCGFTPQYEALEALQKKYGEQGLSVVGVPCNQFMGQEPGTAQEILTFCKTRYDVSFDLLEKSNVKQKGPDQAPLYAYLTSKQTNPEFGGDIKWNFTKFLFNRQGEVIARFESRTKPDDKRVIAAIEKALAE